MESGLSFLFLGAKPHQFYPYRNIKDGLGDHEGLTDSIYRRIQG